MCLLRLSGGNYRCGSSAFCFFATCVRLQTTGLPLLFMVFLASNDDGVTSMTYRGTFTPLIVWMVRICACVCACVNARACVCMYVCARACLLLGVFVREIELQLPFFVYTLLLA